MVFWGTLSTAGLFTEMIDVLIDELQQGADGLGVQMVNSLGAVGFHPHKSAGQQAFQMVRDKALFTPELSRDSGDPLRPFAEETGNIPPHVVPEGFKEELVRLVEIHPLHNMNYFSYHFSCQERVARPIDQVSARSIKTIGTAIYYAATSSVTGNSESGGGVVVPYSARSGVLTGTHTALVMRGTRVRT